MFLNSEIFFNNLIGNFLKKFLLLQSLHKQLLKNIRQQYPKHLIASNKDTLLNIEAISNFTCYMEEINLNGLPNLQKLSKSNIIIYLFKIFYYFIIPNLNFLRPSRKTFDSMQHKCFFSSIGGFSIIDNRSKYI